jgi:hypothetical protein
MVLHNGKKKMNWSAAGAKDLPQQVKGGFGSGGLIRQEQ